MNTLAELKQLIHKSFGIETALLKEDMPLAEYGLDSLSQAELLFNVEDHFNIDIPDAREHVNTLAALADLIDELRVPQAA